MHRAIGLLFKNTAKVGERLVPSLPTALLVLTQISILNISSHFIYSLRNQKTIKLIDYKTFNEGQKCVLSSVSYIYKAYDN